MVAKTRYRCSGDSHQGMVRHNNEDRFYADPDRGIFMVVDGIGGQAAGEKAADIAITRVRGRLERQTGTTEDRIREAITVANNEIVQAAASNPEWKGMACVLTVAVLDNGTATIGHVGDSRLYKIRRGEIKKVTHDHSPVGEREDRNEISEGEAMRHPRRNEVYRDVGSEEHTPEDPDFIEIARIPFEPDSALLLCSDGLSDQVTSGEILRAVQRTAGDPATAVQELIESANAAGGKDNVTVLIVEGDQFAAERGIPLPAEQGSESPLVSKPAVFIYGILAAALILGALHRFGLLDTHPKQPPPPKTIAVGTGALATIGEAMDRAQPGDTIEVAGGEYREQVKLKDGVTLRSRRPDVPILRAPAIPASPAVGIVAEGVKRARVSGFRILGDDQGPLSSGVAISNSDLELQDMVISGAATGIDISGESNGVLRANSVEDCRDRGIRVSGKAHPWILFNAILRNGRKLRDAGPGVLIEDPARAVLIGNTFADNGGDAVSKPAEMDNGPIVKFNFFMPKTARGRGGAAH
ncbi:MAG: protein phosphatase 2C domain-containing protein [Bryobacteraceae bacterium]